MTSIKPPGGKPPIAPGSGPASGSEATRDSEAPGRGFADALDRAAQGAQAPQGQAADATATGATSDPIAALAEAVKAGSLDGDQAVEQLLQNTLQSVSPGLSETERGELLVMLRAALEDDPALASLKSRIG